METEGSVAVIMRTKNRPVLLERAIQSVTGQTFENWQLVIVNDGGEREPVDYLVNKYASELRGRCIVLHNETSRGMEAASNQGIAASRSKYLVIHDDDDSWAPNFLLVCTAELEQARRKIPSVRGVVCYAMRILERIERGAVSMERTEEYNQWLPQGVLSLFRMAESNVFAPICFLYYREVISEIGGYRADLPVLGDWEFNLRFMAKYDISVVPYTLAYYHHRLAATGDVGNSVQTGANKHAIYNQVIRNELLRSDIQQNALGIGTIVNLAQQISSTTQMVDQLNSSLIGGRSQLPPKVRADSRIRGHSPIVVGVWTIAGLYRLSVGKDRAFLRAAVESRWRMGARRRALGLIPWIGMITLEGGSK